MRRIAAILMLLLAAGAGGRGDRGRRGQATYQAELFNAFGLVEGSELRIAGVKAGTVTGLDITAEKTALVTFEVGPGVPRAEGRRELLLGAAVADRRVLPGLPAGLGRQALEARSRRPSNQTTVQTDLVQNTLREPFKRRFQLIINEFGTALVGNPENLNAAIRSGAPALRELRKVLKILGRQNQIIAQLNVGQRRHLPAARRPPRGRGPLHRRGRGRCPGLGRAPRATSPGTSTCSTTSSFELKPVMVQLGNLAREQTPLLTDLNAAAPGLNKLGQPTCRASTTRPGSR